LRNLVLETDLVQQAARLTTNVGLVVEDLEQALPNLTGFLARVDRLPDAGLLVVPNDRCGLGVICDEALLKGLGVVVGALDEGLASDIVDHVALGRIEDLVVRAARCGVNETTSDARYEERVVDLELDGVLERLLGGFKHAIKLLCLNDCSWETVENETG
jgi:hypothetical protein